MEYVQPALLGLIQGIVEWLPVSSEGVLVLVQTAFFGATSLREAIELVLFLHLGTFFAALVYFRKDVIHLARVSAGYRTADPQAKALLRFLVVATLISGVIGYGFLSLITHAEGALLATTQAITLGVGFMLLITAYLQFKTKKGGTREIGECRDCDSYVLGVVQGFAALPGLSRSGLTVAGLLLRGYSEKAALKISFLMSLPIVLGGNIILNVDGISFSVASLVGLAFAFVFGYLTIGVLLKIARKVQFAYFVLFFGLLTIVSAFI